MSTRIRVVDEAFVTLATNDRYAIGALVLCSSLMRVETTRQLVVLVTSGVSEAVRAQLLYAFDVVVNVNVLDSNDAVNLNLLGRPDLGQTFTKLHCWRLTQYTKCVFLDADTLVLHNIDDLFDREELSAAPDVGWPDCFNSGVFVYRPSLETYSKILELGLTKGSFDGGDQGLLNLFFNDWSTKNISRHLPFVYNVVGVAFYSYLPAFKQFGRDTKVAHFIGKDKPWHLGYNKATGQLESHGCYTQNIADFAYIWWKIYMEDVNPKLIGELASLVNVFEYLPPLPSWSVPPVVNDAVLLHPSRQPSSFEYHMETPFVLPDIPVYYEPPHGLPPPTASDHEYVDTPESRYYGHMESFYSEPPMKHREAYPEAEHVYEAKEFSQTWTDFRDVSVSQSQLLKVAPPPESVDTVAAFEKVSLAPEILPIVTTELPTEQPNLQTSTRHQLDERQHQFNWERGQIDYLGIDSFKNILSKLNDVLEEPSGGVIPTQKMTLPAEGSKKTRGVKTSPSEKRSTIPGSIPGDRLERTTRTDGRSRAVVTDEGAVFYEPRSNRPPAIAAGDRQLDHVERDMSVEIRKHKIFINSSTGEPEERQQVAEERIKSSRVEDSTSPSTVEGLLRDAATSSDGSKTSKDDTQCEVDVPSEVGFGDGSHEQADSKTAKDVLHGADTDTDTNIIRASSDAGFSSTGADADAGKSGVTPSAQSSATVPEKSRSQHHHHHHHHHHHSKNKKKK